MNKNLISIMLRSAAALLCLILLSACNANTVGLASTGSVIINEVMSVNSAFFPAGNGGYYDWVELYNPTDSAIDLDSCYITDNEDIPLKYRLNGLSVEPKGYAVIFLSGLNTVDEKGFLHTGFKLSSSGETLTLSDKHGNVLSRVQVPKNDRNISYGLIDDGKHAEYVWFSSPTPLAENSRENYASSADKLEFATNGVIINEFMTDNTYICYDADGDYGDWIELYNPTETDADMTGYSLTDSYDNPSKWVFPEGTVIPAGGYMLVFCDGKDMTDTSNALHTSFSLGSLDTVIALYTNQGILSSSHNIPDMPSNISGGYPLESDELKFFSRPTPGKPNDAGGYDLTADLSPDINRGLFISEVLNVSSRFSEYTRDYIEIFNSTSKSINLGGYTLAQTPGEHFFTFPQKILKAGEYAIVYCDGINASDADSELHSAIKINNGGEDFYLAEPDGRICDYFSSGKGIENVSSGRSETNPDERYFFAEPTPCAKNSDKYYTGYAPMPDVSHTGGYVEKGTSITLTAPPDCEIVYTTDGSLPNSSSERYTQPIVIDKTTVLRAAAVCSGKLMSQCVTQTYLVEEPHSISVVSLSSDPYGLFSNDAGILVHGYHANYTQDWEREAHIEFFDESGKKCVEFDSGVKVFGQYSRTFRQKGLRLALREIYGANEVFYPFFPESISGVSSFSNLLLRPSGQDQVRAKLRDELVPAIIRGRMDIDFQEYRACALYINGEYWGLYYIRERLDADYLERKYGFEEDSFDLIKQQYLAQAGSNNEWFLLEKYCKTHDLTVPENYEYICSQVDIDSLINFWIVETYFANADSGNIKSYKTHDGKWRWMLFDFDWAMYNDEWKTEDYIHDHLLDPNGHGAFNFNNDLIRKLLQNENFRDKFISTYCYHINTTFDSERMLNILDEMIAVIEDEMPRHYERWGVPSDAEWQLNLKQIRSFCEQKPDLAIQQLQDNFDLSDREIQRYLRENK